VPVSVDHTAMADYITDDNAIVVESEIERPAASIRRTYQMFDDFKLNIVRTDSVLSALRTASQISEDVYENKSRAAIRTVESVFGCEALRSRIQNPIDREFQS
jgi:hypothetical protein